MLIRREVLACLGLLQGVLGQSDLATPTPRLWDSCDWVAGKGGGCYTANPSRPFQEYLQPDLMAMDKMSGIIGELAFDLHNYPDMRAKWIELGELSEHRVRLIEYVATSHRASAQEIKFAGFLVIERTPELFAPLFRWGGGPMPTPNVFTVSDQKVLVVTKDFGGNVPMVATWAWVWIGDGPMRIEVEKAVKEALTKVAPGHSGYDTGIDWSNLHVGTAAWGPDGYPGKIGVHEGMEAWFELDGNRLLVKRVIWRDLFDQDVPVRHWPIN